MSELVFPLHFSADALLPAAPTDVFAFLDDFENLGAHMMRANWMMAGSRMTYEFDGARGRGPNARVKLHGSVLGLPLDIDECVTTYLPPRLKVWQTTGTPRLILMGNYRMGFEIQPHVDGARLRVFIDYALPARGLARWLGRWLAGAYARWCVRSMTASARQRFGAMVEAHSHTGTQERYP